MRRKDYEKPTTHVIKLQQPALLLPYSKSNFSGSARLINGWTESVDDAWGGSSSPSGGGGSFGGWTDSGDDAWE